MQSSDNDNFVRCSNCGKKLFIVIYGVGKILIFCRGCHKEVPVRFGNLIDLTNQTDNVTEKNNK